MNLSAFLHELDWDDLPPAVQQQARRCLLDTVGTAMGGRATALSRIIYDFTAAAFGGQGPALWLDGRQVSPPGAALAHASTIDALDAHDGYRPGKGHAGVALIPAALATAPPDLSGRALLAGLVAGYEIALRAGEALHATAADYHTSGAWNALGAAAVTARHLELDRAQTAHALGIAEYYGPRSPMMRCIEHPTMLKDGSGWGAHTGVSAGLLAAAGFTGAPAETITGIAASGFWDDLGERWRILDLYFKPYPVCRWAQPAIRAALDLQRAHALEPATIATIDVTTFAAATRLAGRRPQTTEEAQYSLPFPLAVTLIYGNVGPDRLDDTGLADERVLALARRVHLEEDPALTARFPAERYARVTITTLEGATFHSGETPAAWGPEAPPGDDALRQKFRTLAQSTLPAGRAHHLETLLWQISDLPTIRPLLSALASPLSGHATSANANLKSPIPDPQPPIPGGKK